MKFTIIITLFITFVKSEGYICNFDSLASYGQTSEKTLMYSYYDMVGNTYIKRNEYGFESQVDYCTQKGDATLHPNEDLQVKCNDSRNICNWENNSCVSTGTSQCTSLALCQAVLNGDEAACLGQDCVNDPNGGSNDFLYAQFCNSNENAPTSTDTPTDTSTEIPTETSTDTPTETSTDTPTDTSTETPTETSTDTPTDTSTETPTETQTETSTDTPTETSTDTPTETSTDTPMDTPTTVNVLKTEYINDVNGVCLSEIVYVSV
jgi:hypothetical protein